MMNWKNHIGTLSPRLRNAGVNTENLLPNSAMTVVDRIRDGLVHVLAPFGSAGGTLGSGGMKIAHNFERAGKSTGMKNKIINFLYAAGYSAWIVAETTVKTPANFFLASADSFKNLVWNTLSNIGTSIRQFASSQKIEKQNTVRGRERPRRDTLTTLTLPRRDISSRRFTKLWKGGGQSAIKRNLSSVLLANQPNPPKKPASTENKKKKEKSAPNEKNQEPESGNSREEPEKAKEKLPWFSRCKINQEVINHVKDKMRQTKNEIGFIVDGQIENGVAHIKHLEEMNDPNARRKIVNISTEEVSRVQDKFERENRTFIGFAHTHPSDWQRFSDQDYTQMRTYNERHPHLFGIFPIFYFTDEEKQNVWVKVWDPVNQREVPVEFISDPTNKK